MGMQTEHILRAETSESHRYLSHGRGHAILLVSPHKIYGKVDLREQHKLTRERAVGSLFTVCVHTAHKSSSSRLS